MLGGARDDVVPRSQMQELWTIIRNRGRGDDAAATRSKPFASLSSSVSGSGPAARRAGKDEKADDNDDNDNDDEDGPGPDDPKAPPRIVVDGQNKYIEFGAGTHSECPLFSCVFVRAESIFLALAPFLPPLLDDTCVQPGYWPAVSEFVAGLRPKVVVPTTVTP